MAMLKKQVVQGALDFNRTCWKLKRSQQPPPGHPETYRNLAWQVFFAFQSHVTATAIWNGPSFRRYGSLGACRHHVYQFFSCTKGHSKACHSAFSPIVVIEADQKMNNQTVHEICFAPLGKKMWTFWALGSTTTQSKMYNEKRMPFIMATSPQRQGSCGELCSSWGGWKDYMGLQTCRYLLAGCQPKFAVYFKIKQSQNGRCGGHVLLTT